MRVTKLNPNQNGPGNLLLETDEGVGVIQLVPLTDSRTGWEAHTYLSDLDANTKPVATLELDFPGKVWVLIRPGKDPRTASAIADITHLAELLFEEHRAAAEADYRRELAEVEP